MHLFLSFCPVSQSLSGKEDAATARTVSASPTAPLLRGWGLYVNVAVTKSSGDMNSTQMCTYPCGKVRRKRPVRFVEAHSLQCTHMSKHTAFGLDPSHIGEGSHRELPITRTSRKSRSQTVQWLVGVGDTARGGWEERKKCPFNQVGNQLITTKSLFLRDVFSAWLAYTVAFAKRDTGCHPASTAFPQDILTRTCGLACMFFSLKAKYSYLLSHNVLTFFCFIAFSFGGLQLVEKRVTK